MSSDSKLPKIEHPSPFPGLSPSPPLVFQVGLYAPHAQGFGQGRRENKVLNSRVINDVWKVPVHLELWFGNFDIIFLTWFSALRRPPHAPCAVIDGVPMSIGF